jgi:TIR domain
MSKTRVFISHSAGNDPDTEALELLVALTAALRKDFAVRVDMEDLHLGVNWRSTINDWVRHCDAAVVLISKKALKSPYVAHEVTLLMARKPAAIIPVFLTGVDYKAVEESLLSPSKIQDIQSIVNEPDQNGRVARVVEKLRAVERGLIPVSRQAKMLAGCLRRIDIEAVKDKLAKLEPEPDYWEEDADPYLTLATKMMSLGIDDATKLVIRDFVGELKSSGKLHEVFELVATSWVDSRAMEYVKEVASGEPVKRALATNGAQPLIAKFYVWCASEKALDSSWTVVESSGIFSENAFDELKAEIEAAIRNKFNLQPEDDLEEELRLLDENDEPVFVTLPAAGVDRDVLGKLRLAFQTVTFFLRDGGAGDRDSLSTAEVKFIRPPLEANFEVKFCELYDKKKQFLDLMARRS